jgi:protein-tyrosine phosphatase
VHALQAAVAAAEIDIRLLAGAEVELLHCETLAADDLPGLRLADSPYTLVELPFSADARFAEMLLGLHRDVQPALLAHPERCRAFQQDPELLGRLVEQGMLAQVTAASFTGAYGRTVQDCAWTMLEQGLVHVVASDAHDAVRRPPLLREPLEQAGLGGLVQTLCQDNPAAILAGERPAPAPPVKRPRTSVLGAVRRRVRRA